MLLTDQRFLLAGYAKFGNLSEPSEESAASVESESKVSASANTATDASGFKPTRRVREPPGGSHSNIFTVEDDDDALSLAPKSDGQRNAPPPAPAPVVAQPEEVEHTGIPFGSSVKPSR